mmetsp:Transcript_60103/g.167694  ORF Transcript_60103/g.167694 Transcript_60103/m.167694 type:complete len:206 (-) Transcript_60103:400-1017(-)
MMPRPRWGAKRAPTLREAVTSNGHPPATSWVASSVRFPNSPTLPTRVPPSMALEQEDPGNHRRRSEPSLAPTGSLQLAMAATSILQMRLGTWTRTKATISASSGLSPKVARGGNCHRHHLRRQSRSKTALRRSIHRTGRKAVAPRARRSRRLATCRRRPAPSFFAYSAREGSATAIRGSSVTSPTHTSWHAWAGRSTARRLSRMT